MKLFADNKLNMAKFFFGRGVENSGKLCHLVKS